MNGLIEDDLIQYLRQSRKAKGLDGVGCKAIYGTILTPDSTSTLALATM